MKHLFLQRQQLMLVTQKNHLPIADYLPFVERAIQAGITCVQMREKQLSISEQLVFAAELAAMLQHYQIPLIINDHSALVKPTHAAGVHLGQTDGCAIEARKQLGPDAIIGLSTDTIEQIRQANALPIDYIGVGAIFHTANKPDVQTHWGTDGLQQAIAMSDHPVIAIGGITHHNFASVVATQPHGIAAINLFHHSLAEIKQLRQEYLSYDYR